MIDGLFSRPVDHSYAGRPATRRDPHSRRSCCDGRRAVDSAIVRAALAPWEAKRNYPNFAERSFSVSDFYSSSTCERLGRVKAQYDPRDLIRSTHPIPTALTPA